MKRILAFILCAMLLCAFPIVASAEDIPTDAIEGSTAEPEEITSGEENTSEGDSLPSEANQLVTEAIVGYVKQKIPEVIVLLVTLAGTVLVAVLKNKLMDSINVMNNNAIAISENSATTSKDALKKMNELVAAVKQHEDSFNALAAETRQNAEEKQSLESMLAETKTLLQAAKLSLIEMGNMLAELLLLAGIPTSRKDELYARHLEMLSVIKALEEVKGHDGNEA